MSNEEQPATIYQASMLPNVDYNKQLSEKTQSQAAPTITPFQEQFVIAKANIEKTLISLLEQGNPIQLISMSIFNFWFTLTKPLYLKKPKSMAKKEPLSHLAAIITIVNQTVEDLPTPEFSADTRKLNEKMQTLKRYISSEQTLEDIPNEQTEQQDYRVYAAIYMMLSDCFRQKFHTEAVTNALFVHWLRLLIFFGVSEKQGQKMDYYLVNILQEIKSYFLGL